MLRDIYARYRPHGDLSQRDRLVLENLRLVIMVTQRILRTTSPGRFVPGEDDLIQVGVIGLIEAASDWNESRSRFSTFAATCIRNKILQFLRPPRKRELVALRAASGDEALAFVAAKSEECEIDPRVGRLVREVRNLPRRDAEIIRRYWGLRRGQLPMKLTDISEAMGLTKNQVYSASSRAFKRLSAVMVAAE